ncbi:bifunctional aminoglycoside phosphotransferase/ATP-binding protein [Methylohalobius crimeensis]|uniref:bifunctional aminoglycoside phosphotransferase/ATP-binding protein n=1 Tax=Methylohalobius crimeensis TaxID=244365 RepID=UPI0003B4EF3B|nr:bifunctional aminoglycoside phosphotransferase/ATP-binding protein [Methylohalobius crimeensis]
MTFPLLIQSLLKPSVYDYPTESLQCLETHISWIILTGPYAYKIKKPVDFGFLDFSNLAKRRFYCQEELRLNRRLAPQLYLEVLPVTGSPDSPRFGNDGEPLEYAVKMRQFPQQDLLVERAQRGELQEDQIAALAQRIARFHQTALPAKSDSPYGDPETIHEAVRENFSQIDRTDPENHMILTELADWTETEFERVRPFMTTRQQAGRIRECHGDLHLGNIVLWEDRPLPFDCIEFNPALRWIDPISEIAFTVMDLCARGFKCLGFRFLNDYLSLTGDYAGLRLLPYYLVYRAMVRTKIAYLNVRQHPEEAVHQDDFNHYLRLARMLCRRESPILCITHGFSGSGKSYLGQQLAAEAGALHLRSDVERKRLAGLELDARAQADIGGEIYRADFTDLTYRKLGELARTLLTAGFPVIVDATFLNRTYRRKFRALARTLEVPFLILDCTAPEATLHQRIRKRIETSRDPSDADLKVLAHQLHHHDPLDEAERAVSVALDTGQENSLTTALAAIASANS